MLLSRRFHQKFHFDMSGVFFLVQRCADKEKMLFGMGPVGNGVGMSVTSIVDLYHAGQQMRSIRFTHGVSDFMKD